MGESVGVRGFAICGAVLFSSALAFCACSTTSGEVSPPASGGGGSGAGGSGAGGSAAGGSAAGGSAAGATLTLRATGGPAGSVAAEVALVETGVGQQGTCAAPVIAGACQLTSCLLGGIGSPVFGYGNFGSITASVGTTTVALTYKDVGYPTVDFPSPITLGIGDTMRFQGGDGTSVPAFDVSATIPGLAVITSPVPTTNGGAALIDTSQDLPVTWMPISIGQIQFQLNGGSYSVGGTRVWVACTFDGASGSGVVSQALLSSLKQISGTNATYGTLSSELDATTVIDGFTIVTQSFQDDPSTAHSFSVTLQ